MDSQAQRDFVQSSSTTAGEFAERGVSPQSTMSSPSRDNSVSTIGAEDILSTSDSSGFADDLYFIPNAPIEEVMQARSNEDGYVDIPILDHAAQRSLENSQERVIEVILPVKRPANFGNNTPNKMPKMSQGFKSPCKKGVNGNQSSFNKRKVKMLNFSQRRKSNIAETTRCLHPAYQHSRLYTKMKNNAMKKMISKVVKKEMKSMERVFNQIGSSIQVKLEEIVKNEINSAFANFTTTFKTNMSSKSEINKNHKKIARDNVTKGMDVPDLSPTPLMLAKNAESEEIDKSTDAFVMMQVNTNVHSHTLVEQLNHMSITTLSQDSGIGALNGDDEQLDSDICSNASSSPCSIIPSISSVFSLSLVKQEIPDAFLEGFSEDSKVIDPESTLCPNQAVALTLPISKHLRSTGGELLIKPELPAQKKEELKCDYCGKRFHNNSSLKQHTSFHQSKRPFECDQPGCYKAYKTRSELNRHLIVHTGEKNYECMECGKKFLRKQYLKTHLLRHDESLIWHCTLCNKIFVTEGDLAKHKLSYHKKGKRGMKTIKPTDADIKPNLADMKN